MREQSFTMESMESTIGVCITGSPAVSWRCAVWRSAVESVPEVPVGGACIVREVMYVYAI